MHTIDQIQQLRRSIPIHLRKAAKWADKNDYDSAAGHVDIAVKQMTKLVVMELEAASSVSGVSEEEADILAKIAHEKYINS